MRSPFGSLSALPQNGVKYCLGAAHVQLIQAVMFCSFMVISVIRLVPSLTLVSLL